jgi:hypothetical protein
MRPTTLASPARTSADGTRTGAAVWPRCAAPAPPGRPRRLSDSQLAAIDQALRQGARGHGFDTDHWTLARITRVIERLTGVGYHPGHVWKLLRHRFKWKRASMAAALCYGSHGGGAAIAFHHQVDAYNTETLIGALGQLRRFLDGQKATVLWDGLPAHRSFAMRAWLRRQRSWLVVEPLPGYARPSSTRSRRCGPASKAWSWPIGPATPSRGHHGSRARHPTDPRHPLPGLLVPASLRPVPVVSMSPEGANLFNAPGPDDRSGPGPHGVWSACRTHF